VPTVADTPLYFRTVRVTLPPGGRSDVSAANGIIYQISGSTEITVAGKPRMLARLIQPVVAPVAA
ncbi:hypothetical protein, partial [Limobrevibacterium gyesilva]